jgi:hypothetical protein
LEYFHYRVNRIYNQVVLIIGPAGAPPSVVEFTGAPPKSAVAPPSVVESKGAPPSVVEFTGAPPESAGAPPSVIGPTGAPPVSHRI